MRPRRGYIVADFSRAEIEEVFSVRALLEAEAGRRATERRTPTDARQLKALLRTLEQAGATKPLNTEAFARANTAFHDHFIEHGGGPLVTRMLRASVVIVGMGRIGREIGRRLAAFGTRVVGVTSTGAPLAEADLALPEARLDDALGQADICILLTPLNPRTRGLFGAERLMRLKPGCHLINLARGNIVDEVALRALLAEGRIDHATFDVFHTEPLPADDAMWDAPGVTVTPHVSGELADWQLHAAMLFAENLGRWISEAPLQNLCDPALGY